MIIEKKLVDSLKEAKHAVILNSGGIDSRVTAKIAQDAGYILHSFHIDAVPALKKVQDDASSKTALLFTEKDSAFTYAPPHDWTIEKKGGSSSMPFSGMMMITAAMQYASFNGWDTVFTGLRAQGRNEKHLDKINEIFSSALNTPPVKLVAPLYMKTFDQVVKLAKELGVDLSDTHSCAQNPPCGKCRACRNRIRVGLDI